jgi:3-isopropylmalate/(R)-2-methylmalate dehydratase small subunit
MKVSGRAFVLGDDIDTDVIYPARYLTVLDWAEQATHVFEALGPQMQSRAREASVVAAGWNLGCGSSREHAVTGLLGAGVRLVVAKSFARIFFRNAINNGLAVVESPALVDALADGDEVTVDLTAGEALCRSGAVQFAPLPPFLLGILRQGGLWASVRSAAAAAGEAQ